MERYRTIGQLDDPSMQEGDGSFLGVNSYDSAENLEPGQVQAAVNMDFTTQDAVTRGGFVCLPELGRSPFGVTWSDSAAVDGAWFGVAYGMKTWVAVGQSAINAMTSVDGFNWFPQTGMPAKPWVALTFGAGLFVALPDFGGGATLATSPDGVTWTLRTSTGATEWHDLIYANNQFVAIGVTGVVTGKVMTSPDGITWTAASSIPVQRWSGIAFGANLYVAVAEVTGLGGQVMTSPDGITWTARTSANDLEWQSVTYGNGLFVAVAASGTGNRVMTSPDGITWTTRTSAADNSWARVVFGDGLFVAVSYTGGTQRAMTSPDGINWTLGTTPDRDWVGLAFGNHQFVATPISAFVDIVMVSSGIRIFGSGIYSDPDDPGSQWIALVGSTSVGFYAFGRTSRNVPYDSGLFVSEQSTIVQCNNVMYIFRGSDKLPLYWNGDWSGKFVLAPTPTPGPGFQIIPDSNQATYSQNRLWVIQGKDIVAASDVLDFTTFDLLANDFNLNTGDSDFLVTTYPFGTTTLVVFKNKSIIALTGIDGELTDVVATEITRQVGAIGINAVVSVGSDLVYMSDRNINLLSLTQTSNALQHQTLPLSSPIRSIMQRVNWNYGYKVSMAYWDNKLFVSLPLDNATVCNTVVVYNFVTKQWFGEWTFNSSLAMAIQGWAVATYLGATRLHCITEDGRIFVTNDGQNDISGTTVAEIATSLTTRAYVMDNNNRFTRRMFLDLSTNRPDFSVTAYVEGASESTQELTDQTYSRSESWIFNDAAYDLTNANDDYNRAFRKDYSTGPNSVQSGTGFQPEMPQDIRVPIITRRNGRLQWLKVTNSTGLIRINSVGFEARAGYRSNLIQIG